jgi:hypothetical protein
MDLTLISLVRPFGFFMSARSWETWLVGRCGLRLAGAACRCRGVGGVWLPRSEGAAGLSGRAQIARRTGRRLLAGPGAIVATMLFVKRINGAADAIAFSAALVAVGVVLWLFLRYCDLVVRVLRPSGVELLTRISGLLVSAIAVQLIAGSVEAFVRGAH